jgi:hypothetical protein
MDNNHLAHYIQIWFHIISYYFKLKYIYTYVCVSYFLCHILVLGNHIRTNSIECFQGLQFWLVGSSDVEHPGHFPVFPLEDIAI